MQALEPRLLMYGAAIPDALTPVFAQAENSPAASAPSATLSPLSAVPQLNSDPAARDQLYLDFIGDPASTWGSDNVPATPAYDTDNNPTTFSSTELQNIQEIWARVSEKYSPFNINVTTVDPGTLVHDQDLKVVIGGDGAWSGGTYGGLSYVGSFADSSVPNWDYVFAKNVAAGDPHDVAEAAAHEAGHAFGLNHQSTYNGTTLSSEYNSGTNAAAPIMGVSYSATRGLWWDGPSDVSSTTIQDDMSVLSGSTNGFGYRAEDHGQSIASADALTLSGSSVSGSGLITTTADTDYFSFSTAAGAVSLHVIVAQYGPMLHSKAQLFDAQGNLVSTAATASLGQTISTTLAGGTYYLAVESYGGYGDVGQYTVAGTIVPSAPAVTVSGAASVNEASTFTLNLAAAHFGHTFSSWLIDWGDGQSDSISGNPSSATHVYADGPNSFVIHASATDDSGTYTAAAQSVTVVNVAPTLALSGNGAVIDGGTFSLHLGAIVDPGTDTVSQIVVHWGDGTSATYATPGDINHIFAGGAGTRTITVDLVDEDGTFTSVASKSVFVSAAAPGLSIDGAGNSLAGSAYTLVLQSTAQSSGDISGWLISWGDGTTQQITGDPTLAQHTFAAAGAYTITATATNGIWNAATNAVGVEVANPIPPDTTAPTATAVTHDITATGTAIQFTVTYSDDRAVASARLGNQNVLITGPNGFSQFATLVSTDSSEDGPIVHATYSIAAPAGGWPLTANGTYTLTLRAGQIADASGNFSAAQTLGSITLNVAHAAIDLGATGSKGIKKTLAGALQSRGQEVWYRLTPSTLSKYTLSLSGQKDVARLDLINAAGTVVASKSAKKSLSFSGALPPGIFYLRVTLTGSRPSAFKLAATVKPAVSAHSTKAAKHHVRE